MKVINIGLIAQVVGRGEPLVLLVLERRQRLMGIGSRERERKREPQTQLNANLAWHVGGMHEVASYENLVRAGRS